MVITKLCDLRTTIEDFAKKDYIVTSAYEKIMSKLENLEEDLGFSFAGYCDETGTPVYEALDIDEIKAWNEDSYEDDDDDDDEDDDDYDDEGWRNDKYSETEDVYDEDSADSDDDDEDDDEDDTVVFQTKTAPDGTVYIKKATQVNNDVTSRAKDVPMMAQDALNVPQNIEDMAKELEAVKAEINKAFKGVINEDQHTVRFKTLRDMFENADRSIEDLRKEVVDQLNMARKVGNTSVQERSFESVTGDDGVTHVKLSRNDNGNVVKEEYKLVPDENGNVHKVKVSLPILGGNN